MPTVRGKGVRVVLTAFLGGALMFGTAACGGGGGDDRTADVTMDSTLRYTPNSLTIRLNSDETFTFINKDNKVHNVTIPALSDNIEQIPVDVDVKPGERVAVKIPKVTSAPRDGFFLFYCKFHQTEGMSGRLKISG